MLKSLRGKIMLIILVLLIALMLIIGIFLVNGVIKFYMDNFYTQMESVFSDSEFVASLRSEAAEPDGAERINEILNVYSGALGIDLWTRNYYILDGKTGEFLVGSDNEAGKELVITPNILTALTGKEGYKSDWTASYMDVALPISGGDNSFIIYIVDNRQTMEDLNTELISVVLEAIAIGFIVSMFLSFLLSKSLTAPLERLTAGAKNVAQGDFSQKIEGTSKDEIGVLTDNFNDMATVLESTLNEIKNERNKLDTLFLHMTDGVVAFSRDGKVIHSNPAAAELLGEDLGGDRYYKEIFGELASINEVFAIKPPNFLTLEFTRGERELELFLAQFSAEGNQGGIIAVVHDITVQKKNEDMRREFVANVSHELRTPLTNIRSYAETIAENELPPETMDSFMGVILSETDRMTKIVQDLLTLSRFDSGKSELNIEKVNIQKSVGDIYDAVLLECGRRNQKLILDIQSKIPRIMGDRMRLEQVIMNVVSNAMKYTPDGGNIDISVKAEKSNVIISVKDDGIGIPEKDLPHIFERFYRVDKARSRKYGGTGLGLSIAKEIIQLHNGDIKINSDMGKGTEVIIILPVDGRKKA